MALDETVDLAQQDTDGRMFTTVRKSEHVEQAMPKDEEECKAETGEPKSSASVSSAALMSAAEKLMSLAKMVREKADGWPGNFASVIESVVSVLQGAQGGDKYPSAKSGEETTQKASPADAASTLTSVAERLLSYGKALEEGTVENLPSAIAGLVKELSSLLAAGGKYPSPVAKEEPPVEVTEKAETCEDEEMSEKRGRKISGARLTKLEKMESQIASLHQELKGLMSEVVEEEKKDESVSKQADTKYDEVISMVEKRLGKLEEMVEKLSLRRAEPKGLDIDHTSKVEKRDESSFAGILGLKF